MCSLAKRAAGPLPVTALLLPDPAGAIGIALPFITALSIITPSLPIVRH
jgi:hypothetical protein